MEKQIQSVEVINQHEDGPDTYAVGYTSYPIKKTIHRIADESREYPDHVERVYTCYADDGSELIRIENCPVVVKYKPE